MAKINLLDKELSALIAAGEVVSNPASVVKELVENAIDGNASRIAVEILQGGISYIRVADNGIGIEKADIATAFLCHATSKIAQKVDLDAINTLGFRGEALPSIAAVARVEVITKNEADDIGTCYKIAGGTETSVTPSGCPNGTTFIVRDLFYNTPARLKFLKRDITEGNSVAGVVRRFAVAHPEISFSFIRDNKEVHSTLGDNNYITAIYAVYGREIANGLIPVSYEMNGIGVEGYVSTPFAARANRSLQQFFVNKRYIRSAICVAAVEEGFRNSIMKGKFPICFLNLQVAPNTVDVNVHPAKTEVRFSAEKNVFNAIYFAVKNAILNAKGGTCIDDSALKADSRVSKYDSVDVAEYSNNAKTASAPPPFTNNGSLHDKQYEDSGDERSQMHADMNSNVEDTNRNGYDFKKRVAIAVVPDDKEDYVNAVGDDDINNSIDNETCTHKDTSMNDLSEMAYIACERLQADRAVEQKVFIPNDAYSNSDSNSFHSSGYSSPVRIRAMDRAYMPEKVTQLTFSGEEDDEPPLLYIGEIFKTYICCQHGDEMVLIDKHAAHERINFEALKSAFKPYGQVLLESIKIPVDDMQMEKFDEYRTLLSELSFSVEMVSSNVLEVTAMPSTLTKKDAAYVITSVARCLNGDGQGAFLELFSELLNSIACRGAVKANDDTAKEELKSIAQRVWNDRNLRYCPHGRPVIAVLKKGELEKFFGRA